MNDTVTKGGNTETPDQAILFSPVEHARLRMVSRTGAIADLDEEIGLLLWRLQGRLSRSERREGYRRLEWLLSRKYAGRPIKKTESKANSGRMRRNVTTPLITNT